MAAAALERAGLLAPRTKVLVTGGTGHLGSALIHRLVRDEGLVPADIRVFFLPGTPTRSLDDITGLDLCPADILDLESVRRACQGIDVIFHLAASTSFDPRRKAIQWRTNVEGTRHVLEAARSTIRVRRICYTSTVNVLGVPDPPGTPGLIRNSDPYANRRPLHSFRTVGEILDFVERAAGDAPGWASRIGIGYFDSKLAAQELVSAAVREHGQDVVSVLPGTVFGPYDTLIGSGLYLLSIYRNQLPAVPSGGLSTVHVEDAVEGHILAMRRGERGGRYIVTGPPGDNLSFQDLARIIADVLRVRFPGRRIRRKFPVIPRRAALAAAAGAEMAARISGGPCLVSRAAVRAGSQPLFYSGRETEAAIGYAPKRTFRQAVEEMADYYSGHGLFGAAGRHIDGPI
jgi:dihydroflavonol-4-reductase